MNGTENILPDLEERKSALDTKSSFVVVAPAGSGKTQLLIKRYLKLLSSARAIDSVLCLTFTNKATEEMRERVLIALKNCLNSEGSDENEKELFELAKKVYENQKIKKKELLNPQSFQIYTFHSFCSTLLKKYPSNKNISNFETLDEIEAEILYQKTAEIVISKAFSGEDEALSSAIARRLASLDEKIESFKNQIIELLKNRDRIINFEQTQQEPPNFSLLIEDLLKKFLSNFIEFFNSNRDKFIQILESPFFDEETRNNLKDFNQIDDKKLLHLSKLTDVILTTNGTPKKTRFPENCNFNNDLKEFIKNIPPLVAAELDELRKISSSSLILLTKESFSDLLSILDYSKTVLYSMLGKTKKDFVEIEMAALEALSWIGNLPSDTLEKMQFKIDHILVDEAQDLSDIEYKIISRLTEGWTENDGRTIFFVGDPKQSIYRFRKSNVALFTLLLNMGLSRESEGFYPLTKLELNTNFRSTPKIISFVNKTFSNYFKQDDFTDDIAYSQFYHPSDSLDDSPISLNKIDGNKDVTLFMSNEKTVLYNSFVKTLTMVIQNLSENERVGIIFRRRKQFVDYYKALKENGIDVDTIEGEYLESSYAVKHLFNLLKAALFPSEDIYWISVLGSPFIDLSPEEIYEISKSNHGSWFKKVINSPLVEECKRKVLKQMTEDFYQEKGGENFRRHFEELSSYESIKKIYNFEGVEECREFFRILPSLSHLPPKELISALEHFIGSTFSPYNPLIPKNKVQAMTIHKAKGLEFDYVFAIGLNEKPDTGGRSLAPPPILIERLDFDEEIKAFPFLSAPYEKNEIAYKILKELDKKRQQSEYKRIYYVALTRAKRKLFLFGELEKENRAPSGSILGQIVNSHNLQFEPISLSDTPVNSANPIDLTLPTIPTFAPQTPLFKIARASEESHFSKETHLFYRSSDESEKIARAKGVVIHKILENLAKGKNNLNIEYLKKLFKNMNVKIDEHLAQAILREASEVWNLESFKKLRESKIIIPEYSLEMLDSGNIYVGRIDLLLLKDSEAITIDYKTAVSSENLDEWIKKEKEKYKSQMQTYRKMVSLKENLPQDRIKCFILFTALNLLQEIV